MDQHESAVSVKISEQDQRTVTLTVREARWVAAALYHYREAVITQLLVPEPEPAFLDELQERFFDLLPEALD